MTKYLIAAFAALTLSFCCTPDLFADAGVPVVVVTPKAVAAVNDLAAKIPAELPALVIGILVFLAELVMRLIPTVKPRSLLIIVGNLFAGVGLIFTKLSKLADNLVQNLKDPGESEKKDG
jgi:hypothetical protein